MASIDFDRVGVHECTFMTGWYVRDKLMFVATSTDKNGYPQATSS